MRSVSAYGSYYSTSLPSGVIFPAATGLGSDIVVGGQADLEWRTHRKHSAFSLVYIPAYSGRIRYSSWSAFNHHFFVNAAWNFASRWKLTSSVVADISNIEGFLFAPTVLASVASVAPEPASLSASMMGRPFTNTALDIALNNGGGIESAIRTLLYGQRVLMATGRFSISRSYTPRLSVNLEGSVNRYQHIGGQQADIPQTAYLIAATTSGSASLGLSYAVSPRTQLGAVVTTTRVVSAFNDFYTTSAAATLGRNLGPHWFVRLHAGTGVVTPVKRTSIASTGAHPAVGATLGLTTFSHMLIGSYEQTAGDPYAVGASSTSTATASWRWHRPEGAWQLYSSLSWQDLRGINGQAASSWRVTAGWGRRLQHDIMLHTEYAYLNYSGLLGGLDYTGTQSALRVSAEWLSLWRLHR